jgi:hypothetical protein
MPILGNGWEFHIQRLGLHASGGQTRTYGSYTVFIDGRSVPGLSGFACERPGPGDNAVAGNGMRIEAKRYALSTQFGATYRTVGYSTNLVVPASPKMPGILLTGTGNRTAILIHPGHPPNLFLSSVGCINLTDALEPHQAMDFWDSRQRVVALIDSLRAHAPGAFLPGSNTRIPNAFAVIDGEPMNLLHPGPPPVVVAHHNVGAGAGGGVDIHGAGGT